MLLASCIIGSSAVKLKQVWNLFSPEFQIILTILKQKNLSVALKVETDQFVICLVFQSFFQFTLEQ